jgi:hypothetical protein
MEISELSYSRDDMLNPEPMWNDTDLLLAAEVVKLPNTPLVKLLP